MLIMRCQTCLTLIVNNTQRVVPKGSAQYTSLLPPTSMKLEIGLAFGTPSLIVEEDPLGLTVVEVIEVVIDKEGFPTAHWGLGLKLASPVQLANHIHQGSSASPDQHGNGQGLSLSGSPNSHAHGSQPPTQAAILVPFPSCKQGHCLQQQISLLNCPGSGTV